MDEVWRKRRKMNENDIEELMGVVKEIKERIKSKARKYVLFQRRRKSEKQFSSLTRRTENTSSSSGDLFLPLLFYTFDIF